MSKKPAVPRKRVGRSGLQVSLHPLTADQAIRAFLAIKPEDVQQIASKAKNRKKA